MRFTTAAIICALRSHGEHGAVVRLMTRDHGLLAAYVRGARGRRMRPVLMAGNVVEAAISARTESQLPQATVELIHSRGPLLAEPLPAAAIDWATVLVATALPEGQAYPAIHDGLEGLLDAVEAAPSASAWAAALVRFELLLLAELGFGLDLSECAVTGDREDLIAVSPKSGRAVSASEAEPYLGKLLPLPAFVVSGGPASLANVLDGLALSGHFLRRDVVTGRSAPILHSRDRLFDRLARAAGH